MNKSSESIMSRGKLIEKPDVISFAEFNTTHKQIFVIISDGQIKEPVHWLRFKNISENSYFVMDTYCFDGVVFELKVGVYFFSWGPVFVLL